MGLEKLGINIDKEITAWTRKSSKSLLVTKPPVKLNIQGLKYTLRLTEYVCIVITYVFIYFVF